jgi:hypothetical protein
MSKKLIQSSIFWLLTMNLAVPPRDATPQENGENAIAGPVC